jgi:hypothetical protein
LTKAVVKDLLRLFRIEGKRRLRRLRRTLTKIITNSWMASTEISLSRLLSSGSRLKRLSLGVSCQSKKEKPSLI